MSTEPARRSTNIHALFNLLAGLLFVAAAFHLLTGERGVDWMWLVVGVLFLAGGVWGLRR
jgi:hypothetical protein